MVRTEEGTLQIQRVSIDLRELIESAIATLDGVARSKRIKVHSDVEPGGPVTLDAKLVRRALEDLLGNALKFTHPGKDVSISARRDRGAVVIEVADRGPGMPPDVRAGMLSAASDGSGSAAQPALGLGLYMVELVARGHGGKLEILDREGGGSILRLLLRASAGTEGEKSGT